MFQTTPCAQSPHRSRPETLCRPPETESGGLAAHGFRKECCGDRRGVRLHGSISFFAPLQSRHGHVPDTLPHSGKNALKAGSLLLVTSYFTHKTGGKRENPFFNLEKSENYDRLCSYEHTIIREVYLCCQSSPIWKR